MLQRRASALKREADAATRRYDRSAWARYVAFWVPIPLFVLSFKHLLDAWHYYVLGALFFVAGAAIYTIEVKAAARRDRAIDAAEAAQQAYEAALQMSRRDGG